jgi:hypothetical protein
MPKLLGKHQEVNNSYKQLIKGGNVSVGSYSPVNSFGSRIDKKLYCMREYPEMINNRIITQENWNYAKELKNKDDENGVYNGAVSPTLKTYVARKIKCNPRNLYYNTYNDSKKGHIKCHIQERPTIYKKANFGSCLYTFKKLPQNTKKGVTNLVYRQYINGIKYKEKEILDSNYQNDKIYAKINKKEKKLVIKRKNTDKIIHSNPIINKEEEEKKNYNEYFNGWDNIEVRNYKNGRLSKIINDGKQQYNKLKIA